MVRLASDFGIVGSIDIAGGDLDSMARFVDHIGVLGMEIQ